MNTSDEARKTLHKILESAISLRGEAAGSTAEFAKAVAIIELAAAVREVAAALAGRPF